MSRSALALLAIVLAGAALRIALWGSQAIVSIDGTAYIRMARSLLGEPGSPTVHQYGYPALIAAVHAAVGDWVLAARLVALVSGIAVIPLVWLLAGRVVANPWLRLLPAAAAAFLPFPVRYSLTTMTESPYLALLLLAFLLAARSRWLASGILGGLAYTVRPEALLAIGVIGLSRIRRVRVWSRLAAGALLVAAPYVIAVGVTQGSWSLSGKTINLASRDWREAEKQVGEEPVPGDLRSRLERFGGEVIRGYPPRAVEIGEQVLRQGGWTAPLLALGGAVAGAAAWLLGGVAYLLLLPFALVGPRARFVTPALPFLWILAAVLLARVPRPPVRAVLAAVCLGGLGATAYLERTGYLYNEDGYYPELVRAGEWLAGRAEPGQVVASRKPYVAFYAGLSGVTPPTGDYHRVLDELVEGDADYLVAHEGVLAVFRPELLPLVHDRGTIENEPRLRPIYHDVSDLGLRTLLYRVVRPGDTGPGDTPPSLDSIPHAGHHFAHAILAVQGGRWENAARELDLVLAREPDHVQALLARARVLIELEGDPEEVLATVRRAEAIAPGDPQVRSTLAGALRYAGRPEEAEKVRGGP